MRDRNQERELYQKVNKLNNNYTLVESTCKDRNSNRETNRKEGFIGKELPLQCTRKVR